MEHVKNEAPLKLGERPQELDEKQWTATVLADEMTRSVQVSDETFAKVREAWGERETVELVATVACYNCVSRFLVALDGELFCFLLPCPSATPDGVAFCELQSVIY